MDRTKIQEFITRSVTDALKQTVGYELRTDSCLDCGGTGGGTAPGVWCRSCEGSGKRGAAILEQFIDACRRYNASRPEGAKFHYELRLDDGAVEIVIVGHEPLEKVSFMVRESEIR